MFGLFSSNQHEQASNGPFGLAIGEKAIDSNAIGAPMVPLSYGLHGEIFDDEAMHSFYHLNPPEHHHLFYKFYGRYVNAYGEGRRTGLSRVIACSVTFDERETNCVLEFFRFLDRLRTKYGQCVVVDKRSEIFDCDELPDKKIPESIWRHIASSRPCQAFTASWELMGSNKSKIDKVNLTLYVESSYGLENIRYDKGYLALEYIFSNDRNADEIYQETLRYRGEKDDDIL